MWYKEKEEILKQLETSSKGITNSEANKRLKKEGLNSEIILQVHDEIIINAKKEELEKVKILLKEEMENVIEFSVKLEVDENVGKTWYEAK